MSRPLRKKSSIEAIRARFDADVDRFSVLETGQAATVDAPLSMELITGAAIAATPKIERVLDIGCGAGNNTILLAHAYEGDFSCDLCDLSAPMLDRARERMASETTKEVRLFEGDFRDMDLEPSTYDVILAAAVLHHLRDDSDWEAAFEKIHRLLRPGGSVWITDLVLQEIPAVDQLMWERYAAYLEDQGGSEYREKVFAYIEEEDSPRPLTYQLDLLRQVGFQSVEVLHKNSCFAAFGAIKKTPE